MKKIVLFLLSLPIVLIMSCSKSDDPKCTFTVSNAVATAAEITYLQNYMSANSITAIQDPSGFFYTIEDAGSGNTAGICSNITAYYVGSLMSNGNVFDQSPTLSGTNLPLGQLIAGWQKGLTHIQKSGKITLYIPPSLGYGSADRYDNQGNLVIPANSYIKFVIHLLDIQ